MRKRALFSIHSFIQVLREEAAKDMEMKRAGWTKRLEYSTTGRKENEDRKLKLEELKQKKDSLQKDRDAAAAAKEEIEAREKEAKDKHDAAWEEIKVGLDGGIAG